MTDFSLTIIENNTFNDNSMTIKILFFIESNTFYNFIL